MTENVFDSSALGTSHTADDTHLRDGTRQKNEFHHLGVMGLSEKASSITGSGGWHLAVNLFERIELFCFCASSCMTFPNVEVRSGKVVQNFALLKLI